MQNLQTITDLLYDARKNGRRPDKALFDHKIDLDPALQAQLKLLQRLRDDGESVCGWKVGLTSGSARDSMGKGFKPFGFILKSRLLNSPATVNAGRIIDCQLEPELCMILGSDLQGASVSAETARQAVSAVAAAFEINEQRVLASEPAGMRVADGLNNWGIVVGERAPMPQNLDGVTVEFSRDGAVLHSGPAKGGIDDHFESLAALSGLLGAHGIGLKAGDFVITGSFDRTPVAHGSRYKAKYSGIGAVEVAFT